MLVLLLILWTVAPQGECCSDLYQPHQPLVTHATGLGRKGIKGWNCKKQPQRSEVRCDRPPPSKKKTGKINWKSDPCKCPQLSRSVPTCHFVLSSLPCQSSIHGEAIR
uniref:Uncharacterized protein n=1 Tax=Sphaerodactylus townsendi TaxID=933632 RepID=A0ACB8F2G7_9SAUR